MDTQAIHPDPRSRAGMSCARYARVARTDGAERVSRLSRSLLGTTDQSSKDARRGLVARVLMTRGDSVPSRMQRERKKMAVLVINDWDDLVTILFVRKEGRDENGKKIAVLKKKRLIRPPTPPDTPTSFKPPD